MDFGQAFANVVRSADAEASYVELASNCMGLGCFSFFFFMMAIGMMILGGDQLRLALRNMTTNERMNCYRYAYMRGVNGVFFNPFDGGRRHNILEFLHLSVRFVHVFSPFSVFLTTS